MEGLGGCCTEHLEKQRKYDREPDICEQPSANDLPDTLRCLVARGEGVRRESLECSFLEEHTLTCSALMDINIVD